MKINAAKGHQIKQAGGRHKTRQVVYSGTLKSLLKGTVEEKKNSSNVLVFFRIGSVLKNFTLDLSLKVFTDRIPYPVRWEHGALRLQQELQMAVLFSVISLTDGG